MELKKTLLKKIIEKKIREREAKEQQNIEEGELIREKIGQNISEATKDAALVAPQGAMLGFADEAIGLVDKEAGEKYRQAVEAARERSPYATFGSEALAETAITAPIGLASKFLRGAKKIPKVLDTAGDVVESVVPEGSIRRTMAKGYAQGYGEAEEEPEMVGAGVAVASGAMHGAGRFLKRAFEDPQAIRARMFGVNKTGFTRSGPMDPVEAISELESMGAFSRNAKKFDSKTGKYVRDLSGSRVQRKQAVEQWASRLDNTIGELHKENQKILKNVKLQGDKIKEAVFQEKYTDPLMELFLEIEQTSSKPLQMAKKLDSVETELLTALNNQDSLSEIYRLKRKYQEDAKAVYKAIRTGNVDPKIAEDAQIDAVVAEWLNYVIEDIAGESGKTIRKNNQVMSKHIVGLNQLEDAIANERRKGMTDLPFGYGVFGTLGRGAVKAAESMAPPMLRAKVGETLGQEALVPFRQEAEDAIRNTMIRGSERLLDSPEVGRSPQSIPNINPIVEDKLIPRSSEWVMQHPNTVRAKLLTAAPELAAQVSIALERKDMKTLQKVMPQIANMVPHVFEQDDYGIFDGKIIDPNMRALYSQKIMDDQMLDSIEKAEILDHLNRTNEVLK